jgi:uncharacterized metal-binding protein YceD (DUF177 family)
MSETPANAPEFSRPVSAESIGNQAQLRHIAAEPAEREALARRFGLLSLERLSADLELRRLAGDTISLSGHLNADVVQSCVVTLVPLPARIDADFAINYGVERPEPATVDLDPLDQTELESLADGQIDLGEAVAQQLAIALDPYPRAPGAALPSGDFQGPEEKTGKIRPFAGLSALKKRP